MDLENLDWDKTLSRIQSLATSNFARTEIQNTRPHERQEQATQQLEEIKDALELVTLGQRPSVDSLNNFNSWYDRLTKKAVLKISEILDVKRFCFDSVSVQRALGQSSGPWAKKSYREIMDSKKILSAIDQLITPEGEIRSDASETLFGLFNEKKQLEKNIRMTLDKLVKSHQMESLLQDKYVTNREGRWVLPIRSGKQHDIEGIIHDSSQTKQTVFMEPQEIIPINNKLREVEFGIEKEVQKLLTQLSQFLSSNTVDFDTTFKVLLNFDIRMAQASFAKKIDGHFFKFNNDSFSLMDVRHPLLVLQEQVKVVPNTVRFDKNKRILILTGPNAGGKTVLLKAIGLCAHLARCGLPIPAGKDSEIPFFSKIYVAIGDTQNVDQHLSTFASHLKTLTEATKAHGSDQLILVDEICGSTDPEEGAALSKAFIDHYADQGVFGIITSHLGPLKQIWAESSPIVCGSMEYDKNPTYKLFLGIHGRSFAIKTAKNVGVPESIIEKALSYLSPETRKKEGQLDEIETYKTQLLEVREKLAHELQIAEENKEKHMRLLHRLESEKTAILQKSVERAEKRIEKIIEEMKLEKSANLNKLRAELPQIVKSTPSEDTISDEKEFAEKLPPGSTCFILSLNQDGIIQGVLNNKGEVPVLSKSMRIQVHWKDIIPKKQPTNSAAISANSRLSEAVPLPKEELEIDLRGLNADEAVTKLERILDKAVRDQLDKVKIIHGHGTNVLKKSIRSYLSRSLYIQKWQVGTDLEGDGVTWAILT